jgi:hypothetical protein
MISKISFLAVALVAVAASCRPAFPAYRCITDCEYVASITSSSSPTNSSWQTSWSYTTGEGTYYGEFRCSTYSSGSSTINGYQVLYSDPGTSDSGFRYCWCHLIGTTAACILGTRPWVYTNGEPNSYDNCIQNCAYECAFGAYASENFKQALMDYYE